MDYQKGDFRFTAFCEVRPKGSKMLARATLQVVSTERSERAVYPACPSGEWFIFALSSSRSSAIFSRALAWSCRACTSSS